MPGLNKLRKKRFLPRQARRSRRRRLSTSLPRRARVAGQCPTAFRLDNILFTMAVPTTFPILQQTFRATHAHESFSASRELEAKLRQVVRGEVRFDQASRALYATDASNYRQVPIGLAPPLE